jgi:hypothetical protein
MKRFEEFNIKTAAKGFEGDKIKIAKILDREILIHDYKIEDSKHFKDRGNGKCLHLQISLNNEKHIVFTGATGLIETITQVPKEDFPFITTIREENDRYKFT